MCISNITNIVKLIRKKERKKEIKKERTILFLSLSEGGGVAQSLLRCLQVQVQLQRQQGTILIFC